MAKDKSAPAIDDETVHLLEADVKKKKPRKFFYLYKGTQIRTLVVFKKGPFGPKIMKAKKAGFLGDICYGVVVGSGEKLTFQIPATGDVAAAMKVDSWEPEPPVEVVKLKKFLKDNGLSFKPHYEMINSVSDALDPEQDEAVATTEPGVDSPQPSQEQTATEEPSQQERFKQRLAKILPVIKKMASTPPGEAARLKAGEAGEFARSGDFGQALNTLDEVVAALKGETPPPPPEEWNTLQRKLTPLIKKILTEKVGDFAAVGGLFKQAIAERESDPQGALEKLKQCARLVKQALSRTQEEKPSTASSSERGRQVSPNMAFRQSRLTWAMAKDKVQKQLRSLKQAILSAGADLDASVLNALDQDTEQLYEVLGDRARDLQQKLDVNVESQSTEDQQESLAAVLQVINGYQKYVDTNDLVQGIDKNPFGVVIDVKGTLSDNLSDLKASLVNAQAV